MRSRLAACLGAARPWAHPAGRVKGIRSRLRYFQSHCWTVRGFVGELSTAQPSKATIRKARLRFSADRRLAAGSVLGRAHGNRNKDSRISHVGGQQEDGTLTNMGHSDFQGCMARNAVFQLLRMSSWSLFRLQLLAVVRAQPAWKPRHLSTVTHASRRGEEASCRRCRATGRGNDSHPELSKSAAAPCAKAMYRCKQ